MRRGEPNEFITSSAQTVFARKLIRIVLTEDIPVILIRGRALLIVEGQQLAHARVQYVNDTLLIDPRIDSDNNVSRTMPTH